MATFTTKIYESITLNGNDLGCYTTNTIENINNIDNRTLVCVSGSWTTLFSFDSSSLPTNAGTFSTSSFKYGRVTNLSDNNVLVNVQTYNPTTRDTYNVNNIITPGNSFMLSSTVASNSGISSPVISFTSSQYVYNIQVSPSGSNSSIEYYIATT